MKVCVFGAGAIGAHLGARLERGGATVSVVARGAQLQAIVNNGVRVITPTEELHWRPAASDKPQDLGEQDVVLVTVKSPSLPAAALAIAPLIKGGASVAFLMNGIPWWYSYQGEATTPHFEMKAPLGYAETWEAIGPKNAFGGVIYSACTVVEPGVIRVQNERSRAVLGEPDGSLSERARALAQALTAGGVETSAVANIRQDIWEKLVANTGTGPLAVLTQSPPKEFLADPYCERLARSAVSEVSAIAAAMGYPVQFDIERQMIAWKKAPHMASIAQDVQLGRPVEFDAIYGIAWNMAQSAGVPTPTLDMLLPLVKARARAAGCY